MKRNILSVALVAFSFALFGSVAMAEDINVIPTPQEMVQGEGHFSLTSATLVAYKGKEAKDIATQFGEKVARATGFSLKNGKAAAAGTVSFILDKTVSGAEAYTLEVTPEKVVARASTSAGLFYAMQTIFQLLPPQIEMQQTATHHTTWNIPAVSIKDAPRFEYRGVMLDPCRHFLPAEAVKRQIEHLASYKINRIHWHLTDDQGWRIEIKKYPLLTTIGQQRTEGDGSITSGFYTQDEIRDVVEYAHRYHIEIIPEVEMPGHGMAAIAAYPWLSCQSDTLTPRIIWGVEDIVFCPGKETTYRFLEDVLDEVCELFPSPLVHIGGDESPRGEWEKCDSCQHLMKAEGYKKEAQLQSYLIARIGKHLAAKGRHLIGWDEILEGGNLDTTNVVMSWRGEDGGIAAAGIGNRVLMTPSSCGFYFDTYQSDPATEPTAIGGYSPLQRVYSYNPVPAKLHAEGKDRYVMGIQGNCWSEYIHNAATLEYRLFPRALALAEVGWTQMEKKNYPDFVRRVDNDAALRLQAWNVNFHIPAPEQPGGSLDHLAFVDNTTVELTTVRPLRIVYTLNGTQPTASSPTYDGPIAINRSTTLRTAAILPCGIMGPTRTIDVKKQKLAPAQKVTNVENGLTMNVYRGTFQKPYAIPEMPTETKTIADFAPLRTQAVVPNSVRNVDNYAAVAEGYLKVEADGVYEFHTNNNQLWIDGTLVVDNSQDLIPRHSPNNAQKALAKGLHRIKVVFLGGIYSGWPTYWDDATVAMRQPGEKWSNIAAGQLFRAK